MVKNLNDAISGYVLLKNNIVVFVAIFFIIAASNRFFGENKLENPTNWRARRNFDRNFCEGGLTLYCFTKKDIGALRTY